MKGFINLTHTNNGKIAKAKSELQTEIQNAIQSIIDTFYSKQQVQQLIANLAGITFKKVEVLPTENILTNVIYLVPVAGASEQNLYEEYMYIDDMWEKIGTTAIDLSGYVTLEEYNKLVNNETLIKTDNGQFKAGEGARGNGVAVGRDTNATNYYNTAVGSGSSSSNNYSCAYGYGAKVSGHSSAQIGEGNNTQNKTLQIFDDNIYNHENHTATFQNLELNGENILNMFPTIEEIDDDEEV